ncbi:MAG: rhamnogalacturonan lyase [Asticcacaulis sp.]
MTGLKMKLWAGVAATVLTAGLALSSQAQAASVMQVEALDRGVVAVTASKGVLVSWRALANDAKGLGFNVYRDGQKLNARPITDRTNFADESGSASAAYEVREVKGGKEAKGSRALIIDGYLNIPLNKPADGVAVDGKPYSYNANDASVADLDGDGQYEIILKWDPDNSRDNAQSGYTGPTYLDAYKLDGTQLWRIDLGRNIRSGAHYTQFQVADYDGDGFAELIVKTADGTVDGQGKVIGDARANWLSGPGPFVAITDPYAPTPQVEGVNGEPPSQRFAGRALHGPEYLSLFDGRTGAVRDTIPYPSPRGPNGDQMTAEEGIARWGDNNANRADRYLAGTAWLDGVRPSAIFARGYYTLTTIAAIDVRDGKLVKRWYFDSSAPDAPKGSGGQGNHQLSVADVDGDGKHEIIYGAMALDDNGKVLWNSGMGHGDAMHVSDLDPNRPGLERWGVHENMKMSGNTGGALLDARTGEVIFRVPADKDTGRGAAGDIDPRFPGAEFWGSNSDNLFDVKGNVISDKRPRQLNFMVWWDGDLLREILDGNKIYKWDWEAGESRVILEATGATSNNGTKATPTLSGDIFGDWREEVILRAEDNRSLRIYSTSIPTTYRFTTLMHDPQYRAAIAWQNTAYNQPPWPSYFIGEGMKAPPVTKVQITGQPK